MISFTRQQPKLLGLLPHSAAGVSDAPGCPQLIYNLRPSASGLSEKGICGVRLRLGRIHRLLRRRWHTKITSTDSFNTTTALMGYQICVPPIRPNING